MPCAVNVNLTGAPILWPAAPLPLHHPAPCQGTRAKVPCPMNHPPADSLSWACQAHTTGQWTQPFCSQWHSGFWSRAYHGVDIPFTRKRLVTNSCQPLRYCSRCSPRWARTSYPGERASRTRVRPSLTCASLPPGRRLVTASGAADAAPGAHPVPGTQRVRESQQLQDPAPALPSLSPPRTPSSH